jgi:DNA repair protein RecO (recombination protein O)
MPGFHGRLYRDDAVVLRVQKLGESDRIITMLTRRHGRVRAVAAIAETAERLTPEEEEPALRLYLLTLGAIRALAGREHASTLVLDAYLLRAMAYAGWAPALSACAVCGTEGRHRAFSVPAGGCVCPDCRPPGAAHPAPATLDLMAALADGDWRTADASEAGPRRQASGLVAAHLQWHLERALRSLPLVDRSPGEKA